MNSTTALNLKRDAQTLYTNIAAPLIGTAGPETRPGYDAAVGHYEAALQLLADACQHLDWAAVEVRRGEVIAHPAGFEVKVYRTDGNPVTLGDGRVIRDWTAQATYDSRSLGQAHALARLLAFQQGQAEGRAPGTDISDRLAEDGEIVAGTIRVTVEPV